MGSSQIQKHNASNSAPSIDFRPRRYLSGGHVQTIASFLLPRKIHLPVPEERLVEVAPGVKVRCFAYWQEAQTRCSALTLIVVHGLEGSHESQYMSGVARNGLAAGTNVVLMNQRNCGGMDACAPTLYNSSLSADVAAVARNVVENDGVSRFALIGFSMGGNLVLKLAGEWGRRAPLAAVATVCPVIDLAAGSDALHEPPNRLYEWHFLRRLMRRYQRKVKLFPHIYERDGFGPVRSLREFDDKIVARYCGFRDADDYYYRVASARVVDRIGVPTLILRALDDPFIRLTPETRATILANPAITLLETPHGGHCAYLGDQPGDDIHWAELTVVRYLLHHAGGAYGG